MNTLADIPVTVSPEAAARVAELGMQAEFDQLLEKARRTLAGLRRMNVVLDPRGWTPLIYAATGGHDDVVAYLLDQGANINGQSPNGTTALMMAVRESRASTFDLLLRRGADVQRRNENGASALDWAKRGNETAMAEKLRRAGAKD